MKAKATCDKCMKITTTRYQKILCWQCYNKNKHIINARSNTYSKEKPYCECGNKLTTETEELNKICNDCK